MMRSALAGVLLAGSAFGAYAVNEKPFTVPEVRQWKGMDGTLTLSATSRITYTNPKLAAVASQLAEAYKALTGVQLVAEKAKATAGDIELQLKSDKKLGTEGCEDAVESVQDVHNLCNCCDVITRIGPGRVAYFDKKSVCQINSDTPIFFVA